TFVEPMQERHRIALKHRMILRVLALLLGVLATAIFALHHPMATLLVFGALTGVIAYGRKTITRPLRTFLYLKPIAVGTAIVCFAWALNDWSNSIRTIFGFILICSADALLCDIVDTEYDAASGCNTLALKLGAIWAKITAAILYLIGSVWILYTLEQNIIGLYFFVVFVFTLIFRISDQRSLVDFRMLLVVLLAWGEWLFWTTALG
ncbi:MAG: 4-hydroxybenzoate polyprenyltransferase, partial [Phycisphaerales bacterium]